ncbi:MAG: hypothetical protein JW751_01350 [Polyangiaceae bacterium]|nr:hypothetical protein [Polyangiaceae bacterium]
MHSVQAFRYHSILNVRGALLARSRNPARIRENSGPEAARAAGSNLGPAVKSERIAPTEPVPLVAANQAETREQRRSRRKHDVRARTISVKRMTRREVDLVRRTAPEPDYDRPKTRAECVGAPRPCPFISCKYHLYLDVSPRTGSIKLNFPDLDVADMPVSCALDIADAGGSTLEDVGAIMNLTRERIRQLEVKALSKLEALNDMAELRECGPEAAPPPGRRLTTGR